MLTPLGERVLIFRGCIETYKIYPNISEMDAKLTLIQFMDSNTPLGEMVFIFRGCIETYNAHCFYAGNSTVKVKKILEDLSKHFRKKCKVNAHSIHGF